MSKTRKLILLGLSAAALLTGGGIYLLFRSESLRLFRWAEALGLKDTLTAMRKGVEGITPGDFTLYTLPDALWLVSYLLLVFAIIPRTDKRRFYFWLLLLPSFAICHELLQALNIINGVYDTADLVCYIIPLTISIIISVL